MNIIKMIAINGLYAIKSIKWKKSPKCVILDSWFGQKFADNPRYLFQYLSDNKELLNLDHVVWITHNESVLSTVRSMGYEAYMINSEESKYYHMVSKYHIVNNAPMGYGDKTGELLYRYSYRSKRINLWHGTGVIKNFGYQSNDYKKKISKHPLYYRIKNTLYKHFALLRKFTTPLGSWGDCYFLTTSKSEQKKLEDFFCVPSKRVIISGYPRVSYKCNPTPKEREVLEIIDQFEKTILYLPTFRSSDSSFDIMELSKELKAFLLEHNVLLIQKAHSASGAKSEYSINDNVLILNTDFDINVVTPVIDFVVTDYSSILADALFFYKPILLYTPDFDEYMNSDRGLCNDAKCILSAGIRFDSSDLLAEFFENNYRCPEHLISNEYKKIRERVWGNGKKDINSIWKDIIEWTK